ncbi:hypothetical protein [Paraburkholderia rhynchosiae]|uniref:Helix-turn-helix domain-containing protein n=1 Tax=Paraburkholderia rhynchosiae TaxID=487049 RepID=A0A2N7WTR1_9BURK|nr:hypothetical protein [Paraburkholderia rhynchosiae]PMS32868.1 hypothetical protein C0Z16_04785 [Paraburkholderia rhynchosiae]CAB3645524.1 hypothetical protein LMG27174_00821 [Paraburkholderia rhynchosiae]
MGKSTGKKGKAGDSSRVAGNFAAVPHVVLQCPAYLHLSHTARSLLLEFALQRNTANNNNGRLLCTAKVMEPRGWKSADTLNRAKKELLEGGFLFETAKGRRPNKAGWYAITWHDLADIPGYDEGAKKGFVKCAFMKDWLPPGAKPKLPYKQSAEYMASVSTAPAADDKPGTRLKMKLQPLLRVA